MCTTDRRGYLVPKHLEFLNLSAEIDSLNSVTDLQDGPSQTRWTIAMFCFKTLQLLKIGYWEQLSDLRDGSAGRTVVGTTDRHRLFKEIESLKFATDRHSHDGPSQVA
ncbi:hypothetical protein EJD97_015781 [Solanum chilense]|uniref:Uncharacterized protein n=1 Tax=Solanum chilense TaxID=4083 RepID=A0A6N2BAV2_SOLCI|nr:hypothetical protein EJD97_015781 [Solanum chilense]